MDGIKLESESPVPFIPQDVLQQLESIVGNYSDSIQSGDFLDSSTKSSIDDTDLLSDGTNADTDFLPASTSYVSSSPESSTSMSNGHQCSSTQESSTSVSFGHQRTQTVETLPNVRTSSCRKRKRQEANWARTIKNKARQKLKI